MSEFAKYSTLLDMKNFEILGFRAVGMFLWWWCWGDGVKMSATMVDRRGKKIKIALSKMPLKQSHKKEI